MTKCDDKEVRQRKLYNFISHCIFSNKNKGEDIGKEWTVNAAVYIGKFQDLQSVRSTSRSNVA